MIRFGREFLVGVVIGLVVTQLVQSHDIGGLNDRVTRLEQEQPAPVSPHACDPPLCTISPSDSVSAAPTPPVRPTPTRPASRSRRTLPTPSGQALSGLDTRYGTGSLLDITCYTATGSRTASGKWPQPGMAAGNRWPFGTRLHIDGLGTVTVEDRIGWGSDVDLFMTDPAACRRFGRKHLHVQVIR